MSAKMAPEASELAADSQVVPASLASTELSARHLTSQSATPPMVVTHEGPASEFDKRYEYDRAVLRLALEATRETHGDFVLQQAGSISFGRLLQQTKTGKMPNIFIKTTYEKALETRYNVDYVPFPVDLGITGYRVCFLSGEFKQHVAENHSLADIKSYSIGQGGNWADTDILIHNGFSVKKVARYDYLFAMTKARRFDLFCRGANEIKAEYEAHKNGNTFAVDESFVIKYPFPRYYYTHKSNGAARIRILEGLVKSYNNGSLKKLWREYYGESIAFAQLHKRVVHKIGNPLVEDLAPQYFDFYKKVEADTWQYILQQGSEQ